MVLTWETKVVAVAGAAETNWKHKVTPDWGDLMMYYLLKIHLFTRFIPVKENHFYWLYLPTKNKLFYKLYLRNNHYKAFLYLRYLGENVRWKQTSHRNLRHFQTTHFICKLFNYLAKCLRYNINVWIFHGVCWFHVNEEPLQRTINKRRHWMSTERNFNPYRTVESHNTSTPILHFKFVVKNDIFMQTFWWGSRVIAIWIFKGPSKFWTVPP